MVWYHTEHFNSGKDGDGDGDGDGDRDRKAAKNINDREDDGTLTKETKNRQG